MHDTQPEPPLGPVVSHLHTDTFCDSCGYNLHAQAVMRDERLGLLVCRCPECGRWAAAGLGATASRVWLNRFATSLLVAWSLLLLVIFGLGTLFLGMLPYGYMMSFTRLHRVDLPPAMTHGQSVSIYRYELRDPPPADTEEADDVMKQRRIFMFTAGVLAVVVGGLHAVFLWHAKGLRRILAFVIPLTGCLTTLAIWNFDPATFELRHWSMEPVLSFILLESAGLGVGLLLGRPVARGLLRILVPPKPRQHLAFLWTIDGRRLPAEG
jgi:hypothetical protein